MMILGGVIICALIALLYLIGWSITYSLDQQAMFEDSREPY